MNGSTTQFSCPLIDRVHSMLHELGLVYMHIVEQDKTQDRCIH